MNTIRITVNAPDDDTATQIKEKFFKKLFNHTGQKVIFEVPEDADEEAKEIEAAAEEAGCEAERELHKDELEDAEPVDFW